VIDQAASLTGEGLALALRLGRAVVPAEGNTEAAVAVVATAPAPFAAFLDLPYKEARRQAIDAFELAYAEHALRKAAGNVSRAAEQAEVHRNVLHRILARARGEDPGEG
jgi:DNA-binding NtrC family response regulator